MLTEVITIDDLRRFKTELLNDLVTILANQNAQEPKKKWLKSCEVRNLLQISPSTLQNLRVNGTLSFTKVGGIIYYSYDEIEQIINDNQINNLKLSNTNKHKGY